MKFPPFPVVSSSDMFHSLLKFCRLQHVLPENILIISIVYLHVCIFVLKKIHNLKLDIEAKICGTIYYKESCEFFPTYHI